MAKISHHSPNQQSFKSDNKFFDEQWRIYQKILHNNYMGHEEIYSVVHQFLVDRYNKPFKLLDLGCGDASFAAQALLNTTIHSYVGVDLSASALEIARDNIANLPGEKLFIQDDLFESIFQHQDHSFEVILASFALHHLTFSQKERFIARLPELLTNNGVFLLVDIFRQPQESREDYLQRYLNNIRQDWSLINSQEFSKIQEHMTSSDFPETQENLYSLASQSGFSPMDCLYRDRLDTTQCLCFYL